ncbi:serine hydrolase [Halobaculum sp. MBLA0143]|uniref:serine hydrolase n=1 Tax=Halobaculum sp. MBLA0143 TaxID=3079933 RepID=UPI003523BB34
MDDERIAAAERFLADWLADERVAGAGLAIVADGEPIHTAGYGARDLATDAPATADTLYGVGSVTKSVTALAVLRTVADTRLSLSDPVSDHLDVFGDEPRPPTVQELLTHTSGMPADGASVALISRQIGGDPAAVPLSSPGDLDRHVAGATADRAGDERFRYYNTGYTLLGRLVATLHDRPFSEYVADELLAPLGMDRAVLAPSSYDELDDAATPYHPATGEPTPFPSKGTGAAGGLVASARDLAAYLRFQTTGEPAVVSGDDRRTAHAAHATRQTYGDDTTQGYGYGWMRRPFDGETLIEHGGSIGVGSAYVGFLQESGLGVGLACNGSPEAHPQFAGPALLSVLRGGEPTDTRFYRLRERADRVAGDYESYRGIQRATVAREGARITVELDDALESRSFEAFPEDSDGETHRYETVAPDGARVPVRFVETDDGTDLFYRRWRLHPV